jgi:hypothetical protein
MSFPTNSSSANDAEETSTQPEAPSPNGEADLGPHIMTAEKKEEHVKIKCPDCGIPTFWDAWDMYVFNTGDFSLPVGQIRVMTCTNCGKIKTTK